MGDFRVLSRHGDLAWVWRGADPRTDSPAPIPVSLSPACSPAPLSCHPIWPPHFSVRATLPSALLSSLISKFPLCSSPFPLSSLCPTPSLFPPVSSKSPALVPPTPRSFLSPFRFLSLCLPSVVCPPLPVSDSLHSFISAPCSLRLSLSFLSLSGLISQTLKPPFSHSGARLIHCPNQTGQHARCL